MKQTRIFSGIYEKDPSRMTNLFITDKNQLEIDTLIAPFYIWETLAHNFMLAQEHLVPADVAKKILRSLLDMEIAIGEGVFHIDPELGDIHENIEYALTQQIGKDAGWFHLARSRNDQITCDQKLLVKHLFFQLAKKLTELGGVLSQKSNTYAETIMPGFTHMRKAMPMSFGFWWQSYLVQLVEAEQMLKTIYWLTDVNPLGAGASYGVNWPIAPRSTSAYLGFSKPLENALASINNRGISEQYWMSPIVGLSTCLSRMMEDIIVWSVPELQFITVDSDQTTGSSIMPQKMNPDIAEKIRAKTGVFIGNFVHLITSMKGTPSGYNRDSAETKIAIYSSLTEMIRMLDVTTPMLQTLVANPEAMLRATQETLATKVADLLVRDFHIPFRDAHRIVGTALKKTHYQLSDVTAEMLNTACDEVIGKKLKLSKKWIHDASDVGQALSLYSYPGTSNPECVKKLNETLLGKNNAFELWVAEEQKKFLESKEILLKEIQTFIR